jgi:hypothetical protein
VSIVSLTTGERRTVQTGSTGRFTLEVPAGRYSVELALHDGETLLKQPDVVDLVRGQASQLEFVLAAVHVRRPHGPAYRLDNGLGSPVV